MPEAEREHRTEHEQRGHQRRGEQGGAQAEDEGDHCRPGDQHQRAAGRHPEDARQRVRPVPRHAPHRPPQPDPDHRRRVRPAV